MTGAVVSWPEVGGGFIPIQRVWIHVPSGGNSCGMTAYQGPYRGEGCLNDVPAELPQRLVPVDPVDQRALDTPTALLMGGVAATLLHQQI